MGGFVVDAPAEFAVRVCGNPLGQCAGRVGFQIHKQF
jgi:hypothetical protein